ncbi:MAG: PAS domain-containing protein [Bacteroidetes bacterium]|nr:PAS domain-containing protein [Bacteroidota bacterium]
MKSKFIFWLALLFSVFLLGLSSRANGLWNWSNLALIVNLLFILSLYAQRNKFLSEMFLWLGHGPAGNHSEELALQKINQTKERINELYLAFDKIKNVGDDDFEIVVKEISDPELRVSLDAVHRKVSTLLSHEKGSNWVAMGAAAMAELKHSDNDLSHYLENAVARSVNYVQAKLGTIYLLKEEEGDTYFELAAGYAFDKRSSTKLRFGIGEGMIGQVFYEKEVMHLANLPKGYITISSGLGQGSPCAVCVVPLLAEGAIYGAMEIASFHPFTPTHINYFRKAGEVIGNTIRSVQNHINTERLLEQSRKMTDDLKSRENEIQQNVDKLQITQQLMKRKQEEMEAILSTLSTLELDLNGQIINANPVFLGIAGYALSDIQGKGYMETLVEEGLDRRQFETMWGSIASGQTFSGEFRILNKQRQHIWMSGNFTPINGDDGKPTKIMLVSLFNTQEKEKTIELQETIAAIKHCFPVAEINPDMTFKSANDLFLSEMGIKRIELKRSAMKDFFLNGSFHQIQEYLARSEERAGTFALELKNKNGMVKKHNSTFIKINTSNNSKKGLLVLRNEL